MRENSRTFISFVGLVMLLPVGLGAQTVSPAAAESDQVIVYGTGERIPLRYEGETVPTNHLSLSVGVSTFYDDNVPQQNVIRAGDEALSLTSTFAIMRRGERLRLDLQYTPYALLYRDLDEYDSMNHNAALNAMIRLSSRFSLGLRDTFSYQNGIFQSVTGQPIQAGLGSPTALSRVVFPFTTRTLSNSSGVDLTYEKSTRSSFTFSLGYDRRQFGEPEMSQPLYNSWGVNGGLQYRYRLTENTSLGLLFVHHDSTFTGGGVIGSRLRFQSESAFVSVGSRLSPTVTVTLFGGPQYTRVLGQAAAEAGTTGNLQAAGGVSVTKQLQKTALDLSVRRSVGDGGGMYTLVKSTSLDFGVRQQLAGRWEAGVHIGAARASASLFQFASGKTDAIIAGVRLTRPLWGGAVFHASYETAHETSEGTLPYLAQFDRNRIAVGVDYRFKAVQLGR